MSSITFLAKDISPGLPHLTVNSVSNPRQVTRACVKARVVCGVYPLQKHRHKLKKTSSPECILCSHHTEDVEHFIEVCPSLHSSRGKYLNRLMDILPQPLLISVTQAVLDTWVLASLHPQLKEERLLEIETITRDMIYALHISRTRLIDNSSYK